MSARLGAAPNRGTLLAVQAGMAGVASASDAARDVTAPAVRLDGVTKVFGPVQALKDLSANIYPGRLTGLSAPTVRVRLP